MKAVSIDKGKRKENKLKIYFHKEDGVYCVEGHSYGFAVPNSDYMWIFYNEDEEDQNGELVCLKDVSVVKVEEVRE